MIRSDCMPQVTKYSMPQPQIPLAVTRIVIIGTCFVYLTFQRNSCTVRRLMLYIQLLNTDQTYYSSKGSLVEC